MTEADINGGIAIVVGAVIAAGFFFATKWKDSPAAKSPMMDPLSREEDEESGC